MSPLFSLAALILAGGASSRMKQDKALITIQGMPLLRRVCEVALECTTQVYVIAFGVEQYRSVVPPGCTLLEETNRVGKTDRHGPLVGFAQGLSQIQTEWVLLLACDLPNLQSEVLRDWMGYLTGVETAIALLPRGEKGWEPLCGFYRTTCLPDLQRAIAEGERSFQRWLTQVEVQELPLADKSMLFNCNTPEELQHFLGSN
jgi:molybdopterin-guanine dinucleotide biosynthesis protein A